MMTADERAQGGREEAVAVISEKFRDGETTRFRVFIEGKTYDNSISFSFIYP